MDNDTQKPDTGVPLKRLVMTLAIGIAWMPALLVYGFAFTLFLPGYALQSFGDWLHDLMVLPVWNTRHRMDCRETKRHNHTDIQQSCRITGAGMKNQQVEDGEVHLG